MKSHRSFRYLLTSLAVTIAGCTLDPPKEFGEPCADFSFIWTDGNQTILRSSESSGEYDVNFQTNVCPQKAPFCIKRPGTRVGDKIFPEEQFCSDRRESCPKDSHPSANGCEWDSVRHCGDIQTNCLDYSKGVANAECIDTQNGKECRTTRCLDTFTMLDAECKRGDECCGDYCKNCAQFTPAQICYNLDVMQMDCGDRCPNETDLKCNGVCINPDTSIAFCGSDATCALHYCADEDGWRNGSCIKGQCEASDCLFGYHLGRDGERSVCLQDTPDACGKTKLNCLNEIQHATTVDCVLGRCVVTACETGYSAYENTCMKEQETDCGSVHCGPHQVCNNETLTCECESGYTDCGGQCYDLTSNQFHCGSCTTECRMANAESTCTNSECVNNCNKGFVYNELTNSCDSLWVCEPGKYDCNNNGLLCCDCAGACDGNKCDNSLCEPLVPCREPTACTTSCCIDNMCVAQSQCSSLCDVDYHLNGDTCEPDDIYNCGEPGKACNVKNAENFCITGICSFECDAGFHAFAGTCERNDTDNCGVHGNACHVADAENSCNEDKCEFTCLGGFVKNADGSGCEPSICSNGDESCSNQGSTGFHRTCSDNGWGESSPCPNGNSCKDGHSCGDCINGSGICSNSSSYIICEGGVWSDETECPAPDHATPICDDDECSYSCDSGFCERGSECVSNQTDMNNCGECGIVCNTTKVDNAKTVSCSAGKCIATECDPGYHKDGDGCAKSNCTGTEKSCTNTNNIGQVKTCDGGDWGAPESCIDVSCSGDDCGSCKDTSRRCDGSTPQVCSNGEWTDAAPCTQNKVCSDGRCIPCSINQHFHDGACEDNDNENCGAHGVPCSTDDVENSTAVDCSNGICSATSCRGNLYASNGRICCLNGMVGQQLIIDHSTTCNYKCAYGFTDCSGTCADLTRDNINCGTCGHECPSGSICQDSLCVHSTPTCAQLDCPLCCCGDTDGSYYCSSSSTGRDGMLCRCKDVPVEPGNCDPQCEYWHEGACHANSDAHCGSYSNACRTNETCVDNTCKPKSSMYDYEHLCPYSAEP